MIFLDEIDMVRGLPFSTDEFFAAIRECYNRRSEDPTLEGLVFCLLGVAAPTDLIRDTQLTPSNIGRRIELTDFTPAEAAPLRAGLALGSSERSGREESQALLNRILHWTGGHPYLTQRLCRAVAEDADVKDPAGVDQHCASLFFSAAAEEQDDNLIFVRERLLRNDADVAGLLDLYGRVWAGKRVAVDDTNALVSLLRLAGITRVADDRRATIADGKPRRSAWGGWWSGIGGRSACLRVRNRIYGRVFNREWIRQHTPDAEVRRQQAAYRRGVLRAAAVAGVVVTVVLGLGLTAVKQRGLAQEALRGREQANTSLRVSLRKEQAERARADENAGRAKENARKNAELAEQRAEALEERAKALREALAQKQRADQQTRLAQRNAADAGRQAQLARKSARQAVENAQQAQREKGHALREATRARTAEKLADRRAEEARRNLYIANMNLIQRE